MTNSSIARQAPKQRVSPVQDRSRQKVDLILSVSADILAEEGFDALTMLNIAKRADLPPATVYHYFENRLAIVIALATNTFKEIDEKLIQVISKQVATSELNTSEMIWTLYEVLNAMPWYSALWYAVGTEPNAYAIVTEYSIRDSDVIANMLMFKLRMDEVKARSVARVVRECCAKIVHIALLHEKDKAEELINQLVEILDIIFAHYEAEAKANAR